MRVIALSTTTPEVRPGERPRVDAIVVDPLAPRDVRVRWRLCRESRVVDPRACAASSDAIDLGEGAGVDLPALVAPDGAYFVFTAACVGASPVFDVPLGHFRCADGEPADEVFRRISVRTLGALNHPPGVARWALRQGAHTIELPEIPGARVSLPTCTERSCATWTVELTPTHEAAERLEEGTTEALGASFYVTVGRASRPRDVAAPGEVRALTTQWTPGPVEGELWVVLRDQRGGETVRGARVGF